MLVALVRASPALAACPFLMTEEHGALKVESSQAGAQASLPPQCAGSTLLTNTRGDQLSSCRVSILLTPCMCRVCYQFCHTSVQTGRWWMCRRGVLF